MNTRTIKFNFIMNFILTASSIIFPLITFPYISRVLQASGNGKVAFANSVLTYFTMFASLGIPTYGIRTCAKVRDDNKKLSKTVQELMIINTVMMLFTFGVLVMMIFLVPKFYANRELLWINSISLVLNVLGVNWLYSAVEQYAYIALCSIVFKVISIGMMFAWVRNPEDYVIYAAISVFAASGSYVLNFIRLRKFVTLKKVECYSFRQHLKPIMVFFAMSAAISVYTNLDVVMLGFMKDDAEVGYYNAAVKVKTLLVTLITSLGTVLLPRLSYYIEQNQKDAFQKTIVKAVKFVLLLGIPVMVYFTLFAQESILFLSGDGFKNAILPMMWLMPTVLFIGLSNVTGIQILTPLDREKEVLMSIIAGAVLDFLLNLVLIPKYGASGAAFATTAAELLVLVVQLIYLKNTTIFQWKSLKIWKYMIAATGGSMASVFVYTEVSVSAFFSLVITAVLFFGVYVIILLILKEEQLWEILEDSKNKLDKLKEKMV